MCQPITIAQVAEHLGVSKTLVSLVLNGRAREHRISQATAQRVKAATQELGFCQNAAARQLAGKRSNVVGLLINTAMIADPRLVQRIEEFATERDLRVLVGHAVGDIAHVKKYLDDFYARHVDGVISIFHNHPSYAEPVLKELARFEHVVFYEEPIHPSFGRPAHYVTADFHQVGALGTSHLLQTGRKRIALVFRDLTSPYALARRRGSDELLRQHGQAVDERMIRAFADFTPEHALQAVDELIIPHRVDGVLAVNDIYAARLLGALRKRGLRVPDDVAVIGSDNFEIGTLVDPAITTIDLQVDRLARALMQTLFSLLDHQPLAENARATVIPPFLVRRESA